MIRLRPFFPTLCVGVLASIMLWSFHDYLWWPHDDGVFAHWAERVLEGDVFGRDVVEIHGGYHTFLNALMFHWFGTDLVVLRYPLVVLGVLQAMMITWLLRRQGAGVAVLGGLLSLALGFLAVPSPAPLWYALFFSVVTVFLLTEFPRQRWAYVSIGLVVGLCFMFRHPNAVFLMMGVALVLLQAAQSDRPQPWSCLAKTVIALMAAFVLFYSSLVFEPFAFVLFALPVLWLLGRFWRRTGFTTDWLPPILPLGIGFTLAVLPMVVYQLWYGSFWQWFSTSYLASVNFQDMGFFWEMSYFSQVTSLLASVSGENYAIALNSSVLILCLLGAPILLAWSSGVVRRNELAFSPIVLIALPYAMTAFYYQIYFYLLAGIGLAGIAVLASLPREGRKRSLLIGGAGYVCVWAFLILVQGTSVWFLPDTYQNGGIPRSSLWYEARYEPLADVFATVKANTAPEDAIFSYPQDAHIYFHTERRNLFPFSGTSFFVVTDEQFATLIDELASNPPAMIVWNEENKYNGALERSLTEWVVSQPGYRELEPLAGYRFFVYAPDEN